MGQCLRAPLNHFREQSLSVAPWVTLSFPGLSFLPPPPHTFMKHPGLAVREIMSDAASQTE